MSNIDDSLKIIINDLKKKKADIIAKQNKLIDAENDLKVEISNANRILNDKKKEQQVISYDVLIKRQIMRNENLKEELKKLQAVEEKNKISLSDLRKKVNNINNILSNSMQDYKNKKASLDDFKTEIPNLLKQIEELSFKLANIEDAQNKVDYLETEYKKLNALRNTVIVKFDATVELLNNLEKTDSNKYRAAKSIYDRVSAFIDILKDGK